MTAASTVSTRQAPLERLPLPNSTEYDVPEGGIAVSPTGPDAGDIYVTDAGANTIAVINPTPNAISYPITLGATSVAIGSAGDVYAGDEYVFVIK